MSLRIESLLEKSAAQYAELEQLADSLLHLLECADFDQVREQAAVLQQKQAAASLVDDELLPLLNIDLPAWEGHLLYRQRLCSIQAILELNELLLPKIRGMMAVTSAELEQLRGGRTALVGYATQASVRRGLRGVG